MKKENITIADIAGIAGVSKSTVSRVLTGSSFVEEAKRRKILRAIERTGYVPKAAARSLRGKINNAVGVILNLDPDYHFTDYVSMETLRGISSGAGRAGYRVSVIIEPCSRALPGILKEQSLDGLVIMGLKDTEKALDDIAGPYDISVPLVLLNYSERYSRFYSVSFANRINAYDFTMHVLAMGHRRVGTVSSSPDVLAVRNRLEGIREALDEAGAEYNPSWHFSFRGVSSGEAGLRGAELFLSLEDRPSVIMASDDDIAISFISRVTAAGFDVPGDVSVTGVDNIPISEYVRPPLTTESVSGYQRGILAFDMLKTLLDGEEPEEKHVYIRSGVVERESLKNLNGSGGR